VVVRPGQGAQQGHLIVYTLQQQGGEKKTSRTYLLGRHAVAYDAAGKLDAVYDLPGKSWVDAEGRRTTLAAAEEETERKRSKAEASLKAAPDTPRFRAARHVLRPQFKIEEGGGKFTLRSSTMAVVVTPAPAAPGTELSEQMSLLDRMTAHRAVQSNPGSATPFVTLAIAQECQRRAIYPAVIETTVRAGGPATVTQATLKIEPLTGEQYAVMQKLADQIAAQTTASVKE
jgi:hypothetical protein